LSAVILLAGLLLVRIARPASFSSLAYMSYALRVWPHSPRWPTSRRHSLSAVILRADLHLVGVRHLPSFSSPDNISYALPVWPHSPCWPLLLRVARLTSLPLTYVRTCARNAVLGINDLYLERVVRLASFLTGQHLVRVARLLSFSSLAYISYAFLVCRHSPRRTTSRTRCPSGLILLAGHCYYALLV